MGGILVFGEVAGAGLAPVSLEVATGGAQLADALGEPLLGVLMGADLSAASTQFQCGLSALYLAEGAHYRPYSAPAFVAAAQAVITACSPTMVLLPHTPQTRDWAPQLAARLGTGLVMDCVALSAEGRDIVMTKPVFGGAVSGQFVMRGAPGIATIRTGVCPPRAAAVPGSIVRIDAPVPDQGRVKVLSEETAPVSGGVKLKDAKIVVAGGRGLGGPDNWHYVSETAEALGAAVGCSRPVADSGWVPSSQQVGLSGTTVTPDLYIAVGISGAVQHLAGIGCARTVVAINTDEEAEIYARADFGVVGDFREVLPAFVERVKQLRGS